MSEPAYTLITSRSGFHDALRTALARAAQEGCRELFWADDDFADWPLNDTQVIQSLTSWAMAHRRLTVLARHFDEFPRRHARWVQWRQLWAHVVQCRTNDELEAGQMPTMLLAPGLVTVRLVDPVHHRGTVSEQPADAVHAREAFDALLQRSAEAFPATTLGL